MALRASTSLPVTALVWALLNSSTALAEGDTSREARDDAWWTGPVVAASANTLPEGRILVEPYLYDAIEIGHFDSGDHRRSTGQNQFFGSQTYVNVGLTDSFLVGAIPRFGFQQLANGQSSPSPAVADLTLQAQVRLHRFDEQSRIPTISFNLSETFPTGRYDRLQRAGDGLGAGSYATALSLYGQTFFWMPNGRILRARLDLTYTVSRSTTVRDLSVYGTVNGFRGRAIPGDEYAANLAGEYSLTQRWVLAMDLVWQRQANTQILGAAGGRQNTGESRVGYVVPALEYNVSARMGVIAGARVAVMGRNSSASVTPVAAINCVF